MAIESKAAEIIREAEAKMRDLLTQAASVASYDLVVRIASWARSLSEIKADIVPGGNGKAETPAEPASGEAPVSPPPREVDHLDLSRKKKPAYPKFFRDSETLVKIGWSKAQRNEYEHKAPLSVLSDLTAAIQGATAKKRILTMESLLPLKSFRNGTEVPSYQVYLCLAWLRELGIIKKHGRHGYTVAPKVDLPSKASELFQNLPEQRFEHDHG